VVRRGQGRWKCGGCQRGPATAGTIFDKTRTPLTVWFAVAWPLVVGDKVGISATQVRREMELGSYQTAWAMLHRYGGVMVRPGRERLRVEVEVEVDECFLGGPEPGVPGRGALGKVLFAGAVERTRSGRPGRARLAVIDDASVDSLAASLADNGEPGLRHHRWLALLSGGHRSTRTKPPRWPPPACMRTRCCRPCTWSSCW